MKLRMFKSKKINPIFVWLVAAISVPAFLMFEYVMVMFLAMGLCDNCFEKSSLVFAAIFALSNVINIGIVAFCIANALIIWNRYSVAEYRRNTKCINATAKRQRTVNAVVQQNAKRPANRTAKRGVRL